MQKQFNELFERLQNKLFNCCKINKELNLIQMKGNSTDYTSLVISYSKRFKSIYITRFNPIDKNPTNMEDYKEIYETINGTIEYLEEMFYNFYFENTKETLLNNIKGMLEYKDNILAIVDKIDDDIFDLYNHPNLREEIDEIYLSRTKDWI